MTTRQITVNNTPISITVVNNDDYICITDITKDMQGEDYIRNWMRNKNTLEFLGIWEKN